MTTNSDIDSFFCFCGPLTDAMFLMSTEGSVLAMNEAAQQLLGHTESKRLSHLVLEGDEKVQRYLELCAGSAKMVSGVLTFQRASGPLECRVEGSLIRPGQLLLHCRTGSEKAAELAIEAERLGKELLIREHAIREQAEHANQIKDEFLAVLSHELRTPLSAITGWVQLLQQQQLGAEQVARGLEVIERNVRAQTQLINDLLDVSRILSGKLNLDYRPVELVSVIFTAIDSVELAATKKGISLRANLDKEASLVQGDSIRLQQVIWNLLQNSIKFTPSGGWIEVRLEREGTSVRVTVKDSGAGIAPEFLPNLFERFRQADSTMTRRHGGLGLGLALVREIIELHGGTVRAESPGMDKGTTMTLLIPQRTAPLAKNERPKSPARVSAPTLIPINQLAGLSILLVEDDPDSREIIRFAMQSYGAEVSEASSVAEAKDQLRQRVPDVLVSDIGLPEEDGFALIRYVRKLRPAQGGKVPALALTAFARHVDAERALSEGFDQHLAKPAAPATLVEVVAHLAGRG